MKKLFTGLLTLTLSMSLIACGGGGDGGEAKEEANDQQNKASGEQTEATELNPELVAEGEKVARSSCIGCHGGDLKGDMGPNLHRLNHLSKEQIIEVLIKGRGSMPPASAKDKEEAVAEYLLSLQE